MSATGRAKHFHFELRGRIQIPTPDPSGAALLQFSLVVISPSPTLSNRKAVL